MDDKDISPCFPNRRTALRMTLGAGLVCTGLVSAWPRTAEAALSLNYRRNIKFGKVAGGSDGPGTCIITPAGVKQLTGFAIDFGRTHRAGRFKIRGGPKNGTVQVTLPTSAVLTAGGLSVTIHSFTASEANPVQLNNRGRATIDIGATMDIPANQPAGDFEGSFTIFVDEL